MMHGREKSDDAIVAEKPANKADQPAPEGSAAKPMRRSRWSEGRGPRGMRASKARTGRRAGQACLERIRQAIAVWTGGRSRVRKSRTYEFYARGAR